MPLSAELLLELKNPFGILIPDSQVTRSSIIDIIDHNRGVATVGDATSERMEQFGIKADLSVVDGKERRYSRVLPRGNENAKLFTCSNPPGTISEIAVETIRKSFASLPARIVVQGEEDLLTLPVCALAPIGFAVLYGQPMEGLVAVIVTSDKQAKARELMSRIISESQQSGEPI